MFDKIGSHMNVSFTQEMTDLPRSITTLAQSQLKPGTLHIHVGASNKQSTVKHNQQSSADTLGPKHVRCLHLGGD